MKRQMQPGEIRNSMSEKMKLGEVKQAEKKKTWVTPILERESIKHTATNFNGAGSDGTFFS